MPIWSISNIQAWQCQTEQTSSSTFWYDIPPLLKSGHLKHFNKGSQKRLEHYILQFHLYLFLVVVKSTALNRNKRWPCTDDRVHDCMGLEVQRQGGVNSWGARGLLAFRQASGICLEDPELNLLVPVRTHLLPEDWLSCPASWKTKDVSDATTLFNQSCLIIIPYYLLGACSLTLYSY